MTQTVDEVMAAAREAITSQVPALPLSPEHRFGLEKWMLAILPVFNGLVHQARLENVEAGEVRARGVMLLSNMLAVLVNNTTPDRAARPAALRRLNKLILENLRDN